MTALNRNIWFVMAMSVLAVGRTSGAERACETVGKRFTALPLLNFSSDDGTGYGFRLNLYDYDGRTIPYRRAYSAQAFFSTKGKWVHLLNIDLPTYSKYDVSKILEVPITIKKGYSDAKITYSLLFPGMIMDEGEFTTTDNKAVFRYIPSQFAMQFPNFDIRDYRLGRPRQNDSVFMIFFAEAQSPEGQTVYDVKKLMIREDNLYYFGSTQEQTHPSGHSPGKNDS